MAIALKNPILRTSRCSISGSITNNTSVKVRINIAGKIRNTKFSNSVGQARAEGVVEGGVGSQE